MRERRGLLSPSEQNRHNESMGESNFRTIDQAISCAFEDGKVIMVGGVGDDFLNDGGHEWNWKAGCL